MMLVLLVSVILAAGIVYAVTAGVIVAIAASGATAAEHYVTVNAAASNDVAAGVIDGCYPCPQRASKAKRGLAMRPGHL